METITTLEGHEDDKPMDLTNRLSLENKVQFRMQFQPKIEPDTVPNENQLYIKCTNPKSVLEDPPNSQLHFINNILHFNSQQYEDEMKQLTEMKVSPSDSFPETTMGSGSGSSTGLPDDGFNCVPKVEPCFLNNENFNDVRSEENKENVTVDGRKLLAANNQLEVMRAAKALFSKKTRTLYHWMYPNTPKFQLKSAVSMAWDAMGLPEKQFYVSQVLGKFGCVENRLMINPQLGFLSMSPAPPPPQLPIPPANPSNAVNHVVVRKRGRPRGPSTATLRAMQQFGISEFKNCETTQQHIQQFQQQILRQQYEQLHRAEEDDDKEEVEEEEADGVVDKMASSAVKRLATMSDDCPSAKKMNVDSAIAEEDLSPDHDFTDDPELKKELEKFQWALHMLD